MADSNTKQGVVNEILRVLGVNPMELSRGSTIPKTFFEAVISSLGLEVDEGLPMPQMGRLIAESAGLAWGPECDSTETPSGGGSTVTLAGLQRIHEAVLTHKEASGRASVTGPESHDGRLALGRVAGRAHGQRFLQSAAARVAIEAHAMDAARQHFEGQGWECEDVHLTRSYDLHCVREFEVLHVEVKGTTSAGEEVLLTAGEVELARAQTPRTALFILFEVDLVDEEDQAPRVSGGRSRVISPWEPAQEDLRPLGFQYRVPPDA